MEIVERVYTCHRCKETFSVKLNAKTANRSNHRFCPECKQKNIKESLKRSGERRKVHAAQQRKRIAEQRDDLIWYDRMAKEYGTTYGRMVWMVENLRVPEKRVEIKTKKVRIKPVKRVNMDQAIDRLYESMFRQPQRPKYMEYGENAAKRYLAAGSRVC